MIQKGDQDLPRRGCFVVESWERGGMKNGLYGRHWTNYSTGYSIDSEPHLRGYLTDSGVLLASLGSLRPSEKKRAIITWVHRREHHVNVGKFRNNDHRSLPRRKTMRGLPQSLLYYYKGFSKTAYLNARAKAGQNHEKCTTHLIEILLQLRPVVLLGVLDVTSAATHASDSRQLVLVHTVSYFTDEHYPSIGGIVAVSVPTKC